MTVFIDGIRGNGDRFGVNGGKGHPEANHKQGGSKNAAEDGGVSEFRR
jgi:hypothetical protein